MRMLRIVIITSLVTLLVIAVFMHAGRRAYILRKSSGWHEWADFAVPADRVSLHADIKVDQQKVTVCNSGAGAWTHALIRITDAYLAEIGHLQVGGCKQFELQDFKTNSWKKMPPPNTTVL